MVLHDLFSCHKYYFNKDFHPSNSTCLIGVFEQEVSK